MGYGLWIGIGVVALVIILAMVFTAGWRTVGAGQRGVLLQWGQAIGNPLDPGLHIITPFAQDVANIDVQTQVMTQPAAAASNDLQDVSTTVAVNYHINPEDVVTLYRNLGTDYATKVITPAIQETVKQVVAKFTASDLIQHRQEVKDQITTSLTQRLGNYNLQLEAVSITDFSFSTGFTQAIENKVIAIQNADQALNKLRQIRIEALQNVANANGTAHAITEVQNALTHSPNYLQWLAITKWNGKMPLVTSPGAAPLIPLNNRTVS